MWYLNIHNFGYNMKVKYFLDIKISILFKSYIQKFKVKMEESQWCEFEISLRNF